MPTGSTGRASPFGSRRASQGLRGNATGWTQEPGKSHPCATDLWFARNSKMTTSRCNQNRKIKSSKTSPPGIECDSFVTSIRNEMASPPLAAYRHLLRVVRNVFRGDEAMLSGAYSELRSRFEASRGESDAGVVKEKLLEAKEAADFIRSFVVQAHVNEKGTVRVAPEKHQVESMQDDITEEQFDISVKYGMSRPKCS